MAHDKIAYIDTHGKGLTKVTCDSVSESKNGIELIDKTERPKVIGYVPYDNLAYVGPNEE